MKQPYLEFKPFGTCKGYPLGKCRLAAAGKIVDTRNYDYGNYCRACGKRRLFAENEVMTKTAAAAKRRQAAARESITLEQQLDNAEED